VTLESIFGLSEALSISGDRSLVLKLGGRLVLEHSRLENARGVCNFLNSYLLSYKPHPLFSDVVSNQFSDDFLLVGRKWNRIRHDEKCRDFFSQQY
jgi:hypothetical protein